jgi:hypothetical protein
MSAQKASPKKPSKTTKVIVDLVMPDGWHYFQEFSEESIRIDAGTYDELLFEVYNFRTQNGIPVDTVQRDVDDFICSTYPRQCHARATSKVVAAAGKQIPETQKARFIDDLARWANGLLDGAVEFVLPSVAEARAFRCIECPYNRDWRTSGCSRCNDDASRLFVILRRGKDTGHCKKLLGCTLHKFDTRSAVWIREPRKRSDRAPSSCWVERIYAPGDRT